MAPSDDATPASNAANFPLSTEEVAKSLNMPSRTLTFRLNQMPPDHPIHALSTRTHSGSQWTSYAWKAESVQALRDIWPEMNPEFMPHKQFLAATGQKPALVESYLRKLPQDSALSTLRRDTVQGTYWHKSAPEQFLAAFPELKPGNLLPAQLAKALYLDLIALRQKVSALPPDHPALALRYLRNGTAVWDADAVPLLAAEWNISLPDSPAVTPPRPTFYQETVATRRAPSSEPSR